MAELSESLSSLLEASPLALAFVLGLAAIALAAFALYVVYVAVDRRERR